ncbi:MAG: hypothetical protein WBA59_03970 [Moheibacter sp.]
MTVAEFKNKIIDWVKTGIPKNIKSYNIRTLLQQIAQKLIDVENLVAGKKYVVGRDGDELLTTEINPVEYSEQTLSESERKQALNNLGIIVIKIEGNSFYLIKKPGNTGSNVQPGDMAVNGFGATGFINALEFVSGNPEFFSSWNVISGLGGFSPTWLDMQHAYSVINFPAMQKNNVKVIRILDQNGTMKQDGWATIGGMNGVKVSNYAMLICMADSAGGTYATVGYKYAIVGNNISKQQLITVTNYGDLPDEPDAIKDAIYLVTSTGNLYFWSPELSNFIQIGSIIEGTLVSETEFKDTNNVVVEPDGTHIYKDTTSGIYYKWNGVKYEVFNQTGGGANITDAVVILEDMYPDLGITQDWQRNQRVLNQAIQTKLTAIQEAALVKTITIPISAFNVDLEPDVDCQPIIFTRPYKILAAQISAFPGPTGAAITAGLKKNGTDISPTTRATIPNGGVSSLGQTPIALTADTFAAEDVLTPYIKDIGSTIKGQNLNFILTIKWL